MSTIVAIKEGMNFGVGVDTPSGDARNRAVTGEPSGIKGGEGVEIDFIMNQISTTQELEETLGISASASGGVGLFSASARFDYARSCKINSSSVFIFARVTINQPFAGIIAPGITPEAAALLAEGKTEQFQNQFGDMFVRGIQTGGLFVGVIQIFTVDKTDKETVSASAQGAYAAFSASGSFNKAFQETVSNRQVKVMCHIEGGDGSKPLPSISSR